MIKATLTGLALLTFPLSGAQSADGNNFHCSAYPFKSSQAIAGIKQMAHNITMRRIVEYQAFNWEDAEIRRICKAAFEGKLVDFSCMDGRRNWSAIKTTIPKEWFARGNLELRPDMLALQEKRVKQNPREQSLSYCENLGVISRKVRG